MRRLRRQGVNVSVIYIDSESFGAQLEVQSPVELLHLNELPTYLVRKGDSLNQALQAPLFAVPSLEEASEFSEPVPEAAL